MIGEAFIAGFLTCYIATGGLLLIYSWRVEPPQGAAQIASDIGHALLWPCAFLLGDQS